MIWMSWAAMLISLAPVTTAEQPVDPYPQNDANAGAQPFDGQAMWRAFHEADGVSRIVDEAIDLSQSDPHISDIFRNRDLVRLRRTLKEQFCYILNGGCHYSGRTMQAAHKDMGIQTADMGALVEHLQAAMRHEHISYRAQNRLLAKLAPMKRTVVKQ
ncbi:group 1 truncated hemoglobin [Novosphingobium aquiterrae]|uniref:Group 1 truncated hemoglobin n=1 Tax=Novosphingobium aquiterrae TaxID=624388 RepID=A0ABV6PIL9_9SPHN